LREKTQASRGQWAFGLVGSFLRDIDMAAKKPQRKKYDAPSSNRGMIRGRYDLAITNDEEKNMWGSVDSLSAAAANNPAVRKITREKARYEVANNSYADGMLDTLTSDTIGGEIQLQLGDTELAQRTEQAFSAWAKETKLWAKIRTMRRAKAVDGEAFAKLTTNRKLRHTVKLDVQPFECDMVESWAASIREDEIDGIRFDAANNPMEYRVLNQHPGDHRITLKSLAGEWTKARYVLHYFSELRPGQVRGITELLPALKLFGQLRLFTSAVLQNATRAAEITAVMYTDMLPDGTAAELTDPITTLDAQRNTITSLPEGWKLAQLKAEQPATTYAMFKRELINEIARCLNMPFNVAACDSSSYNYASGRLDHQTYDRSIETERYDLASSVLDRIYAEWLAEYSTAERLSQSEVASLVDHEWHFSGRDHVDPNKEASADETRLRNATLTRARYWAKRGADWKREDTQWIRERIFIEQQWHQARKDAGLPPAAFPGNVVPGAPKQADPDEHAETESGDDPTEKED
jgi:capsid protein